MNTAPTPRYPLRGRHPESTWGWGLVLLCLLLTGCGRVIENKAEKAINTILPQYVGPADKYTTKVSGRTDAMLRGRLRHVRIEGQNVRLTEMLIINKLVLDCEQVSVDRQEGRLKHIDEIRFTARLTEGALNRYALSQRPGVRDLDIKTAADGRLTVRAVPEVLGYPTLPVEVRGTLEPEGSGQKLDFLPDRARVSLIPIPVFVAEHIAGRLNPIVDLSGLKIPIICESIQVEGGAVTLSGTVPSEALLKIANEALVAEEPSR